MDTFDGQGDGGQGFAEDALRAVMALELAEQTTIHNAELQAQRIVEAAQNQAQELQTAEHKKWQSDNQAKLEQYRQEIAAEVQALLDQSQVHVQKWTVKANTNIYKAVEFVLESVILRKTID